MKTKEELNTLTEELKTLKGKLAELTEEELVQVAGGVKVEVEEESSWIRTLVDLFFKNK